MTGGAQHHSNVSARAIPLAATARHGGRVRAPSPTAAVRYESARLPQAGWIAGDCSEEFHLCAGVSPDRVTHTGRVGLRRPLRGSARHLISTPSNFIEVVAVIGRAQEGNGRFHRKFIRQDCRPARVSNSELFEPAASEAALPGSFIVTAGPNRRRNEFQSQNAIWAITKAVAAIQNRAADVEREPAP